MGLSVATSLYSTAVAGVRTNRRFLTSERRRSEIVKLNRLITKSKSNNGNILAEKTVINKAVKYIDQLHEEILNRLLNGEISTEAPIVEHIVRSYLQSFLLPSEKRLALEKLLRPRS
ncbi:hypothetical protein M514_06449 [Trichuris suis]|uniref:Uncharacterized protein n=1 Tax=Trichuris suis TaxID=68888 RepID=A0A085N201_9BILA|nr:hypothetical protein M514_06449 [Trichuris suis]KHJ40095.1 50S ribosomal protein L28 domain protein [Trichuris suis]